MNAPETIKPINDAHKVLMEANDALCVEDVARAILGGDKPTKADIKAAAKRLKELADLGMIEMEPRAGGVPFYRLIAAPPSVVTHNPHTGTPRNPLDIESDPAGLLIVKDGEPLKAHQAEDRILTPEAEAEREDFEAMYGMLGNCSCHISPPCGSCTHPGNPRNQEEDETAWMAAGDSEGGETDAPAADADKCIPFDATADSVCPVPAGTRVRYWLEDGESGVCLAERLSWRDSGDGMFYPIVAYKIIQQAQADFATTPELQYLAPEDYEMPPADPKLLAMANRALHDQAEELRAQLSSIAMIAAAYLPDPSDISTARAVEIMDMLADAQTGHILAQESALETRIQAWVKERGDISHVLEEIVFEPFTTSLLDHAKTAANAFSALSAKHETLKHQITELRTRAAEQAAQYQADIARISSGLAAERQAMNNAINEADRLRAELAAERHAREALQGQGNATDVTAAAVGYLVRVPKRAPILRRKPESARSAALSAVRSGAARAEVLAVVPVGTARRGAEWQSTEAGD